MEVLLLGQTVTLKSGGTPMTIVGWAGEGEEDAVCSFFAAGTVSREVFPLVALTACDPPSRPFEQLETQFGAIRDLVFDINEDVRQFKVKDPHTRGGFHAALVAVAIAVLATRQADLYRKVLHGILENLKDVQHSHDSSVDIAFVEGHMDFFQGLDELLAKLPEAPALPDSQ